MPTPLPVRPGQALEPGPHLIGAGRDRRDGRHAVNPHVVRYVIDLGILAQRVELTAGDLEDGAVGHVSNEPGAVARGERLEPGGRPVHDDPRGRFRSLGDLRRERFRESRAVPLRERGVGVEAAENGEERDDGGKPPCDVTEGAQNPGEGYRPWLPSGLGWTWLSGCSAHSRGSTCAIEREHRPRCRIDRLRAVTI